MIVSLAGEYPIREVKLPEFSNEGRTYMGKIPREATFEIINRLNKEPNYKPREIRVFSDRISVWYDNGKEKIGLDLILQ